MKKIIKENWFKIIIVVAVLIIALSIGYYSKQQGQESNIYLQTQCANQAVKAFKDLGFSDKYDLHTNHYNHKLNKCFIEIYAQTTNGKFLFDANELKEYGSYSYRTTSCFRLNDDVISLYSCEQDDYENFVKSYMEN